MQSKKRALLLLKATLLTVKLCKIINCSRIIKKPRKPKRFWCREFLKDRKSQGAFWTLVPKLLNPDNHEQRPETYFNYFRMQPSTFDQLLGKVKPLIQKSMWIREPISAEERLSLTLRFLCSGDSMKSISYQFRIGFTTVSKIIRETCEAIWTSIQEEVLPGSLSSDDWKKKAEEFEVKWHFPHCLGALDGKHINVQAFNNGGSSYFNYKGSHSVVLMALVDANYGFTTIDIGAEGRFSDGGIFRTWNFGKAVMNNPESLNLPPPEPLINSEKILPYVFVGDEAFPLLPNLMRPFPGRGSDTRMPKNKAIFNYRLSRARRIVENAFGILCNRFRIFRKPIIASFTSVLAIVKASIILHNYLIKMEPSYATTALREMINENHLNNTGVTDIQASNIHNRPTNSGTVVREEYMEYFCNEGSVDWQEDHIFNVERNFN